jgi:hypothetical protein
MLDAALGARILRSRCGDGVVLRCWLEGVSQGDTPFRSGGGLLGDLRAGRGLGYRSDSPCAQHPNMRANAFRRMVGTPRAIFYSVAASRCAFGGWWEYCAAAPTGCETALM